MQSVWDIHIYIYSVWLSGLICIKVFFSSFSFSLKHMQCKCVPVASTGAAVSLVSPVKVPVLLPHL